MRSALVTLLAVLAASCGRPHVQPGTRAETVRNTFTTHAAPRASTPEPVVLAHRSFWPSSFIADSSGLYWTESGPDGADVLFLPVPTNGQSPRSVWHVDGASFVALALDAGSLFAAISPTHGPTSVVRRGKRGGPITTIAPDLFIKHLVYSDGALYVTSGAQIVRLALDGAKPATELALVRKTLSIEYVEVGERHVVFSYLPTGASTTRLARVGKTGGDVEDIVSAFGGLWTLDGASIIASLDDGKLGTLVKIGPDTTKPVLLRGNGTPLGVSGDKLLVRELTRAGDQLREELRVQSLTTDAVSAPVSIGKWTWMSFSDGALWFIRQGRDANGDDLYTIMMFVP